ncbi:MAG: DUF1674 domain-containing protein [Proteobacteria bacterium]|nr:DUF1674 domain-containing protein [Pseudomonadota bacterium]
MTDISSSKFYFEHVLGAAALLFVPMAILLAKGIAPVFAAAGLAVLVLGLVRNRAVPLDPGPVIWSLGVLCVWALLTVLWSITPAETVKTGLSLAATFFGGAVLFGAGAGLDGRQKEIFRTGLVFGGAAGFGLIAIEYITDAGLSRFLYGLAGKYLFFTKGGYLLALKPGLAATALFFWPWALAMRDRFRVSITGPAIAVALGLIVYAANYAVVIALVAGGCVFVLGWWLPRFMPWALAGVVALGVVFAPLIPGLLPSPFEKGPHLRWLNPSSAQRIVIWNNAVVHIREKPVLGAGFDATRALYGKKDRVVYKFPDEIAGRPWGPTIHEPIPLHPHNAVLQVWLELGAVGAAIILVLLLAIIRAIDRTIEDRISRAAALGALTTGLVVASISFGIWQSWWLASILLTATFMVTVLAPGREDPPDIEEIGGPKGLEPTRYGDWENKGRAIDF